MTDKAPSNSQSGSVQTNAVKQESDAQLELSVWHAKVTRLAQTANEKAKEDKLSQIGSDKLQRIQSMLRLAQHPGTCEAQLKQALRKSALFLSAHNVTEAEVLEHESEEKRAMRAGHSIVQVPRPEDGYPLSDEMKWSLMIADAASVACNVQVFWNFDEHEITFTFYGLRDNTMTAALTFEAVYNSALIWATTSKDLDGTKAKNSYLEGIGVALMQSAEKIMEDEEQCAIEEEKRREEEERQQAQQADAAKRARLAALSTRPLTLIQQAEMRKRDCLTNPSAATGSKATTMADVEDEDDVIFVSHKKGGIACEASLGNVKQELIISDDELGDPSSPPIVKTETTVKIEAIDESEETMAASQMTVKPEMMTTLEVTNNSDATVKSEVTVNSDATVKSEVTGEADTALPMTKEEPDELKWQSQDQLVRFKMTAMKVADEYYTRVFGEEMDEWDLEPNLDWHDPLAHAKGKQDARKVDLKRKRVD